MNEWLTFMDALDKGLAHSSLTGFYQLCRAILIKTESDYDKFDSVFSFFFHGIGTEELLPEAFWKWLSEDVRMRDVNDRLVIDEYLLELEELQKRFEERKREQKERHDGGNYWIGTGGTSTMGHGGFNERGIRVGGEGRHNRALQVAGERNFKDFRQDKLLDARQFQMAFRKLKQYTAHDDAAPTELDIDETVNETGKKAGQLSLVWAKPRKNALKLLLLFDSDGSMLPYNRLCNKLFNAVSKSNHFRDLKVYYFHNCIYDYLYKTPFCRRGDWLETDWLLANLDSEYRLIIVGDASMAPSELLRRGGSATMGLYNEVPGAEWMTKIRKRYEKSVWLNPIQSRNWDMVYGSSTIQILRDMFPMYELTIDGLDAAIKKLLNIR
ncbi:MAG: VWA containing CoxE family protein [Clostridiales Family XIII bacterium]|nr:VWA containing CoxE family protein [Clostridiales Family XIII bacterium]